MGFETELADFLLNEEGISSRVGDRVYPVVLPTGAKFPAIVWQRISANREYTYGDGERPWVRARIQVASWATTPTEAIKVGEVVLEALSGYAGAMGDLTVVAFALNELDGYDPGGKVFRRITDFQMSYQEPIATGS